MCAVGAQCALAAKSLGRPSVLAHCRRPSPLERAALTVVRRPESAPIGAVQWGVPQPLKIDHAGWSKAAESQFCGQWRIYRSHGLRPPRPLRQTTAWTRAKACGLSDPKSAGRRQKPAPAARTRRRGPFPARDDLRPPSWLPGRPWRPLRRYGWERGRPAASTPLRASRPCAPWRAAAAPQGLTRPPVHAEGLA
jgi:hypothetical protein